MSKILCRQGEGTKWLTIFAEEMKLTEFFSGKGKALKEVIFYKEKGGFLYAKNM